jgi:hypothetical protein
MALLLHAGKGLDIGDRHAQHQIRRRFMRRNAGSYRIRKIFSLHYRGE